MGFAGRRKLTWLAWITNEWLCWQSWPILHIWKSVWRSLLIFLPGKSVAHRWPNLLVFGLLLEQCCLQHSRWWLCPSPPWFSCLKTKTDQDDPCDCRPRCFRFPRMPLRSLCKLCFGHYKCSNPRQYSSPRSKYSPLVLDHLGQYRWYPQQLDLSQMC